MVRTFGAPFRLPPVNSDVRPLDEHEFLILVPLSVHCFRSLLCRACVLAEVASAADLARTKDSREPVVVVRGLERHVTTDDGPGAAALLRDPAEDLFA